MKSLPRALLLCCGLSCVPDSALAASSASSDAVFQKAVKLARSNQVIPALILFRQLLESEPDNTAYLHHYFQMLGWARKSQKVMDMTTGLFIKSTTPIYVLETIARAARNTRQYDESIEFYRAILAREPGRASAALGLAAVYVDSGRAFKALPILLPMEAKNPHDTEVLSTLAYAYEQSAKHRFKALICYEKLLKLRPGHKDTLRRKIMLLNKLSPTLAYRMAQQHRELFGADEWRRIRWDRSAIWVRWGEALMQSNRVGGEQRFDDLDTVIRRLQANIKEVEHSSDANPVWAKRARYDLIVALRDRFRMQEVIQHLRTLQDEPSTLPLEVRIAAGDAYLYLEKPEFALPWYKSALAKISRHRKEAQWDVQLSLFYTYFELERQDEALALVDSVLAQYPEVRQYDFVGPKQSSPFIGTRTKIGIDVTASMGRAYSDRLAPAQEKLEFLHARAPHNLNIQSSLANIYYWRGWPRRAQVEYEIGLNHDPDHVGLNVGLTRNRMELRQYQQAKQAIDELEKRYPEDKHIDGLGERWYFHNRPELNFWANVRDNSGIPQGNSTLSFEGYLYSAPIEYNYRVFAHSYWGQGEFAEGWGKVNRNGVGLEYRRPNWHWVGEVDHVRYVDDKVGVSLSGTYEWNDYWQTSLNLQSVSHDTPLRAFKNDITAKSVDFSARWRLSELRSFGLSGSFLDFSDHNRRYNISSSWYERWISEPRYKFSTLTHIYHSQNSKGSDAPYYNPRSDVSIDLTVEQDWLTYRHYDLTFNQILATSVGNYWQENHGSDIVGSVRYEHRWAPTPGMELIYGGQYKWARYDGTRENIWQLYLNLNWRF